jgi:hypothetical protein
MMPSKTMYILQGTSGIDQILHNTPTHNGVLGFLSGPIVPDLWDEKIGGSFHGHPKGIITPRCSMNGPRPSL